MSSQNMIQAFLCTPVAGRIETTETARRVTLIKKTTILGSILTVSLVSQAYAQGWEAVDEFIAPTGAEFGETVAISRDGRALSLPQPKKTARRGETAERCMFSCGVLKAGTSKPSSLPPMKRPMPSSAGSLPPVTP